MKFKSFLAFLIVFITSITLLVSCNKPSGDSDNNLNDTSGDGNTNSGSSVTRAEWDAAFDEMIASTNNTLTNAGISQYFPEFEPSKSISTMFNVQKMANGVIYQANVWSGELEELCVTEIDGVDYEFQKEGNGVWTKREYFDSNIKYSLESMAPSFNAIRNAYDSLVYDEENQVYRGRNVELSMEKDGATMESTAYVLIIKMENGKFKYMASISDVLRRKDEETTYTKVGLSASIFTYTDEGKTVAVVPTEGSSESVNMPSDFLEQRTAILELLNSYGTDVEGWIDMDNFDENEEENDKDDSSNDTVSIDKTRLTKEQWNAAVQKLLNPENLTVTSVEKHSGGPRGEAKTITRIYKFAGNKHDYLWYSLNGTETDVSKAKSYVEYYAEGLEFTEGSGFVADKIYHKSSYDSKFIITTSTKEFATMADGYNFLAEAYDTLTFDSATGIYSCNDFSGVDKSSCLAYISSLEVVFSGGNVYQVKYTSSNDSITTVTYSDYGTTAVSAPKSDECYTGYTSDEMDTIRKKLEKAAAFSIYYKYQYQNGDTVSVDEEYCKDGFKITVNGLSEYYRYGENGNLYRYYIPSGDKDYGTYEMVFVEDTTGILLPPDINNYKLLSLFDYTVAYANYVFEDNKYVATEGSIDILLPGGKFSEEDLACVVPTYFSAYFHQYDTTKTSIRFEYGASLGDNSLVDATVSITLRDDGYYIEFPEIK